MKKGWFDGLEENVIAVGIIVMVLMETMNIICKFLLPAFGGLPEELANYAYVWVAFLCASFCTKRGANIIVDALSNLYPAPVRSFLNRLQYILDAVMSVMMVYGAILYVMHTCAAGSTGRTGFPLWIVYFAPVAGFGLNIVRDMQKLAEVRTAGTKGGK